MKRVLLVPVGLALLGCTVTSAQVPFDYHAALSEVPPSLVGLNAADERGPLLPLIEENDEPQFGMIESPPAEHGRLAGQAEDFRRSYLPELTQAPGGDTAADAQDVDFQTIFRTGAHDPSLAQPVGYPAAAPGGISGEVPGGGVPGGVGPAVNSCDAGNGYCGVPMPHPGQVSARPLAAHHGMTHGGIVHDRRNPPIGVMPYYPPQLPPSASFYGYFRSPPCYNHLWNTYPQEAAVHCARVRAATIPLHHCR